MILLTDQVNPRHNNDKSLSPQRRPSFISWSPFLLVVNDGAGQGRMQISISTGSNFGANQHRPQKKNM